ncbi:hypothetical protein V8G54_029073 [Vigna mungo]|uniref:Reverse transcriptase Ty1/copia-type domain-containing protein n=1 Tax=Vigna mungo TaxID=3915 RepID=A0AAQ3MTF8_VIGMU
MNKRPKFGKESQQANCWECGKTGRWPRMAVNKVKASLAKANRKKIDDSWWIDSGASRHICKDRCLFKTFKDDNGEVLYMGNGSMAKVMGDLTPKTNIEDLYQNLIDQGLNDQTLNQSDASTFQLRRSKKARKEKSFGSDFHAIRSQDATFWKEAINDEMESILGNNTWILVDLPPKCKPIGCKWIFKRKMKADGTIDKFKARLVAQGFRQKPGIDYFDTYAPVATISTIRLLIALAAIHKLVIHQMDVKVAFLNGELEEEVYMTQPDGFFMKNQEHKAYSQIYKGKSRHIGVRHSYVQGLIKDGVITVDFVRIKFNLADGFTKALAKDSISRMTIGIGMEPTINHNSWKIVLTVCGDVVELVVVFQNGEVLVLEASIVKKLRSDIPEKCEGQMREKVMALLLANDTALGNKSYFLESTDDMSEEPLLFELVEVTDENIKYGHVVH